MNILLHVEIDATLLVGDVHTKEEVEQACREISRLLENGFDDLPYDTIQIDSVTVTGSPA